MRRVRHAVAAWISHLCAKNCVIAQLRLVGAQKPLDSLASFGPCRATQSHELIQRRLPERVRAMKNGAREQVVVREHVEIQHMIANRHANVAAAKARVGAREDRDIQSTHA